MAKKFVETLQKLSKYIIAALVVVFISFLFPKYVSFNYDYQEGQRWKHDDLTAPFDFALRKNKEAYDQEVETAKEGILPVYRLDEKITDGNHKSVLDKINGEIQSRFGTDTIPESIISTNLSKIYSVGIAEKIDDPEISIVSGNRFTKKKSNTLYDARKATREIYNLIRSYQLDIPEAFYDELSQAFKSNIVFDKELTDELINDAVEKIPRSNGVVKKGQFLVGKGDVIKSDDYQKLESFKIAYREKITKERSGWLISLGYFLLTCLIIAVLMIYLGRYFPGVLESPRKFSFLLLWPALFGYLVYLFEVNINLSTYIIPFCIIPIVIKNFYGERLALFVHIIVVLIASFLSKLGYEFTFLQILVGVVTVLEVEETRYWNKFFMALGIIFLTYALGYLGLSFISEGSLERVEWRTFIYFALNALLTLFAYPFIPILERLFGFTSSITLAELSDMNQPLLKEMSIKAPGTLQHSLQVANLSEAAADKIGANARLIKVAALYHDIGKTIDPKFYIENQSDGENPHTGLNNFESAKKIIDHITEGEKMAKKARLPQVIIDFITTHHGTTRVEYFYRNQKNEFPDREFDESLFRYPGPKPVTKEQTILMLADSIEAAAKSLKNPTGQDIDTLVDKILATKMSQRQLDDSDISFKELDICLDTFKSLLRSIYHVRIEYPEEAVKE